MELRISEGTKVGVLSSRSGDEIAVRMGELIHIGPLTGSVVWQGVEGPACLFLIPFRQQGFQVEREGKREAVGFLVEAGSSFSLKTEQAETMVTFRTEPCIEVLVDDGSRCALSRTPLGGRGTIILQSSIEALRGKVLCDACAKATKEAPAKQQKEST
jgi:hypothetical protein